MRNLEIESARPMRGSGAQEIATNKPVHYTTIKDFRAAMRDAGILFNGQIIGDGRIHRFHIPGHKTGSKNGAYWLFVDDHPNGWFQDHRSGIEGKWRPSGSRIPFTPEDAQRIAAAQQKREAEKISKQVEIAKKAQWIWEHSKPIADQSSHPYLIKKRIQPHGSRTYKEALVIPAQDKSGLIVNLQFINDSGKKNYLDGGQKQGCFHIIGKPSEQILICEGFATGASLHEHHKQQVIVAFDAGNLLPVAQHIRELYPSGEIIICGDNDLGGQGQAKANEAALAIGGKALIPSVPGSDWNDCLNGEVRHA